MSRLKVDNIEARSGNNISMDDPLALKSYDTAGRDALSSPQLEIQFITRIQEQ